MPGWRTRGDRDDRRERVVALDVVQHVEHAQAHAVAGAGVLVALHLRACRPFFPSQLTLSLNAAIVRRQHKALAHW